MRKLATVAILFACVLAGVCATAQASDNPMEGIEIAGIKSMQVEQNSKGVFYLHVTVNLINVSGDDVELKENSFNLSLGASNSKKDEKFIRPIGVAQKAIIELNNMAPENAEGVPVELIVGLGSDQGQVLKTLAYVMNTVGNPDNIVNIGIDGMTKPWRRVDKGWISPGSVEMRLVYSPKIQRDLMFE